MHMRKMKFSFKLRPATMEDKQFIMRLQRATVGEHWVKISNWSERTQKDYFDNYFRPKYVLIIQHSNRPIGAVSVIVRRKEIFIVYLYVLPAFQDKGIDEELVRNVLKRARREQKPVVTCIDKGETQIKNIYAHLGFHIFMEDKIRWRIRWVPPSQAIK